MGVRQRDQSTLSSPRQADVDVCLFHGAMRTLADPAGASTLLSGTAAASPLTLEQFAGKTQPPRAPG
jgi:hypothetical protein